MPRYFIDDLLVFWLPSAALAAWLWRGLDALTRKAFFLTLAVVLPATFAMEFVYLKVHIWRLDLSKDPLIGLSILGAPIEEFLFWFGAAFFILLSYLAFDRLLGPRERRA